VPIIDAYGSRLLLVFAAQIAFAISALAEKNVPNQPKAFS
jgi:hypothetical protein